MRRRDANCRYRRVRDEKKLEEYRTELFAYERCLQRARAQMARASEEERVELRSRVRRYMERVRHVREDVQFSEGYVDRRQG